MARLPLGGGREIKMKKGPPSLFFTMAPAAESLTLVGLELFPAEQPAGKLLPLGHAAEQPAGKLLPLSHSAVKHYHFRELK